MNKQEMKNLIVEICNVLKKQFEKSDKFERAMDDYFDGFRGDILIPSISIDLFDIINKMWCVLFEPELLNGTDSDHCETNSWLDWFVWENEFGNSELEVSKSENSPMVKIDSIEAFANFMCGLNEQCVDNQETKDENAGSEENQEPTTKTMSLEDLMNLAIENMFK